jgi:uncharacterized protein DUF4058
MSPIHSIKNQYPGINAHLHSLWQAKGGWDSFHSNHITYLTSALKAKLLPMGYTAETQQSLQIRRLGEPAGKPESDVTIYDANVAHSSQRRRPHLGHSQHAFLIPEVMSVEDELSQYTAIGIYEFVRGESERGEPVAWIELLSPSNKPGGQDATYYRDKRRKLLHSGIVFVELDYLHESNSTFDKVARYTESRESGSHAYRIMVVDPRPVFMEGLAYPAEFDVDDPIPTVEIPLNGEDVLTFDFNAPYQRTFEELFYGIERVDYGQLPLNFDRYSPDDQVRVLARMLAVLKAVRDRVDLEQNAPLPVEAVGLDDALSRLQSLGLQP